MQGTSMPNRRNTHDTFWHEDQVVISFYFEEAPTGSNKTAMYEKLQQQRLDLNKFLVAHGFKLDFFGRASSANRDTTIPQSHLVVDSGTQGIHLFSMQSHVKPAFSMPEQAKQIQTGVVSVFQLGNTDNAASGTSGSISADAVPKIVNLINDNLGILNSTEGDGYGIQILAASPHTYCGATGADHVIQGCPAGPPIPVSIEAHCQSSPGLWPIELPTGNKIGTGKDVTVFILDSLPKRQQISRAANEAGENNKLLRDVDKKVTFNYQFDNLVDAIDMSGQGELSVAKDIYGRHTNDKLPDHGLFIAGIVHSIAPDASIECIRVLNDYCVGDTNVLYGALRYIHNRMSETNPDTNQPGDLHEKPVVINMSLVIPTDDEAELLGVKTKRSGKKHIVRTDILTAIQSLVGLGAVFAASAGNEGDNPMNPEGQIPDTLYPGAFANDNVNGIIAVGATNSMGEPSKYSSYPGNNGIATFGGETPAPNPLQHPPDPPDKNKTPGCKTTANNIDALIGIYSSPDYPSLSINDCDLKYPAPNQYGWAYWYGTSFSTPIISALLAQVLEVKGKLDDQVPLVEQLAETFLADSKQITWANLDPKISPTGSADGRMIQVTQCKPVIESKN